MVFVKNFFKRALARLIDYLSFTLITLLLVALSPWFFSDGGLILFILTVPLLYALLEAFFISRFATTPGKSLLGLRIFHKTGRKLTYRESLIRSLSFSLFFYTLCIPFAQIYFIYKEITFFKTHKKFSWNAVVNAEPKDRIVGLIAVVLSLFSLTGLILPYSFSHLEESIVERHTPMFTNIENLTLPSGSQLQWKYFASPNSDFIINFPSKPEHNSKDIPIPNSEDALDYQEYKCSPEENITFSISYTTLPSSILKWSPSLVLKGALKLISKHLSGASIENKSMKKFKNLPALEFSMDKEDKTIRGALILLDTRLYKIEIECEKENDELAANILPEFLSSFEVKRVSVE